MLYTVDCPVGHTVKRTYGLIEVTTWIVASERSAWEKWVKGDTATHQDALSRFRQMMPSGANAVVGVRVATAVGPGGDGATYLALTYVGTPVELDPAPSRPKDQP